jgi:hypothetical protein
MRIYGPSGLAVATPTGATRRSTPGAFTVSDADTTQGGSGPTALRTVGGIDALIALQGVEDPTERRRNALKRGRHALDALDELKIGLLGGILSPTTLTKLKAAAGYLKDGSGDSGLDAVLGEIELRVEVEIAKMAPR